MARLLHNHVYPTIHVSRPVDLQSLVFTVIQLAVLGGIGVFLALAAINTILGTGSADTGSAPNS